MGTLHLIQAKKPRNRRLVNLCGYFFEFWFLKIDYIFRKYDVCGIKMAVAVNKIKVNDSLVFSLSPDGWSYDRSQSPSSISLAKLLLKSHNLSTGYGCDIMPSGMSAISHTLNALIQGIVAPQWPSCKSTRCNANINLVCAKELYCSTKTLVEYYNTLDNVTVYFFDMAIPEDLSRVMSKVPQNSTNIVLSETCSNPCGVTFPFTEITKLREQYQFVLILDNTWLTHVILNPFEYDADIVVCSMTKYYSAGKVLSGYIMGKNKYMTNIKYFSKLMGNHVSPSDIDMVIKNVKTINERILQAHNNTGFVISTLKEKFPILHPSLDYSHDIFKHHVGNPIFPSVFAMLVLGKKEEIIEKIKTFTSITYKTSYGGEKTRIDSYPKQMGANTQIRVSIGYGQTRQELVKIVEELQGFQQSP